jgi:1,4-alpha-glucan branching enzyme
MKLNTLLIIIIAAFVGKISAQTVSTDPEFPTPSRAVTVTFDATGSELQGYTGDVYVHTGVIIEGEENWQYVIGNWGVNNEQPQATRISTDLYQIKITPTVTDYYGVQAGEIVKELCMVFRSSDATMQSRPDFFIPVYSEEGLRITSPDSTAIFSLGDDVLIEAVALFATDMTLYVNETEQTSVTANELSYTYTAVQTGNNTIRVVATDGIETIEETSHFFVREANAVADLPSADLHDGINYIDDNTVTLVLYAPFKEFVFVKGSFNNWELTQENQMTQTPDGNRYWITLNDLTPGQEYIYQYVIDGELTIADPYCDKISDPWNDQYINNNTYPNLIDYPSEHTSGIASVFQTAQEPYQWQTTDFQPPANEDLIIYELHIRDFIHAHNYTTLIDTLSYLKTLGINAVELMPVNEFEGNSSWGYNPSFYFAPDKYYGPKNDLKAFIDSCHANGMAVISDIVLNHSYGQSPLVQMYFDPTAGEDGQPTPENPWYNVSSPNTDYSWGFDFDHESQDTKDFVDRVNSYWLEEYKFDGFRFDFTKGFTNTPGNGWAFDQARINILKRMAGEIWSFNPSAYVILEHFADNSEEIILADYGMLIWGNLNHAYSEAAMAYEDGWDFSWTSYQNRGWSMPHLISYMESHDEERMMYRNLNWGNTSGDYDITEPETALERVKLASVFFLTIPGPKMLWQFEELGYDYSINHCPDGTIDENCRVSEKPIVWDYYDEPKRRELYDFFGTIIELRTSYDVFRTEDYTISAEDAVKEIILNGDTMNIHIIGNFDVESQSKVPSFSPQGTWYEYFTGTEINTPESMTLAAGEYRLYTNKKIPGFEYAVPPVAADVSFTGELTVGDTLSGTYSYSDANNDPEGESIYQWYTAAAANGAGTEAIAGANELQYILTGKEKDKYIALGVTPVAESDNESTGKEVRSDFEGPAEGIEETTIYPNPLDQNELTIMGEKPFKTIIIYDRNGQKLFETELPAGTRQTIETRALQNGFYIIQLKNENTSEYKKLQVIKNNQ